MEIATARRTTYRRGNPDGRFAPALGSRDFKSKASRILSSNHPGSTPAPRKYRAYISLLAPCSFFTFHKHHHYRIVLLMEGKVGNKRAA